MLLGCCSRWLSMGCISRFEKLGCCSRWLNLGCFSRFEYLNIYATEQAGSISRPNGRKPKQRCNQKNRLAWVGGDGSGWLLQPVAVAAGGCCSLWLKRYGLLPCGRSRSRLNVPFTAKCY